MLSRVADSIYWLSRYVERAENVARFIEVNLQLMLDAPSGEGQQWEPLVNTTGDPDFDGTLKQGLTVQLEQSPYINIFPEERARETLVDHHAPRDRAVLRPERPAPHDRDPQRIEERAFDDPLIGWDLGVAIRPLHRPIVIGPGDRQPRGYSKGPRRRCAIGHQRGEIIATDVPPCWRAQTDSDSQAAIAANHAGRWRHRCEPASTGNLAAFGSAE